MKEDYIGNKAKEQFDQCVTINSGTDEYWGGWYELAGIYEYESSFEDALTIYNKITKECPPSSPLPMMAMIKIGELLFEDSSEVSLKLFHDVVDGPHPFPLPRLIASFYTGRIDENTFISKWNKLQPDDPYYRYYLARKALFVADMRAARFHLLDLKRFLVNGSWQFYTVSRLLNRRNW